MLWDDIVLVTEMVEKYGLQEPLADLGGLAKPTIADYSITIKTGDQNARYVTLKQRPFNHISPGYVILNPENGDPPIENLGKIYHNHFGCVVCLSVMEHVENPYSVFDGFWNVLRPGGLAIVSTFFSFPYHPGPEDNWRYSPNCLRRLASYAGLETLEADWRVQILGNEGVNNMQTGQPCEIHSVYIVMSKGKLSSGTMQKFVLPERA